MATRRLALIGAALGPWIHTASVRAPFLKIDGLDQGSAIMLRVILSRTEDAVLCFTQNGLHELLEGKWMQASCEPRSKSVICEVISKEAA